MKIVEMEGGCHILGKFRRSSRRRSQLTSTMILPGLEVHFYLADTQQIIHLKGCHSAEQLCIEAARKLGELLLFSRKPDHRLPDVT